MQTRTAHELSHKKCEPCEGGVPRLTREEAVELLKGFPGWRLSDDGRRIRKTMSVINFMAGIDYFNEVAKLAEDEGHHPDLHLENYRNIAIELWTHAIGGLSENDFILAAKIDELPVPHAQKK